MKRTRTLFGRIGHDARPVWPDTTPAETPAERDLLALTTRGVTDIEWRRAVTRASLDTLSLALLDPTLTGPARAIIEGRRDSIKHRPHHTEPLEPITMTPEEI